MLCCKILILVCVWNENEAPPPFSNRSRPWKGPLKKLQGGVCLFEYMWFCFDSAWKNNARSSASIVFSVGSDIWLRMWWNIVTCSLLSRNWIYFIIYLIIHLYYIFQIHWLSIINSMVLVFLLIGFVVIILVSKH